MAVFGVVNVVLGDLPVATARFQDTVDQVCDCRGAIGAILVEPLRSDLIYFASR